MTDKKIYNEAEISIDGSNKINNNAAEKKLNVKKKVKKLIEDESPNVQNQENPSNSLISYEIKPLKFNIKDSIEKAQAQSVESKPSENLVAAELKEQENPVEVLIPEVVLENLPASEHIVQETATAQDVIKQSTTGGIFTWFLSMFYTPNNYMQIKLQAQPSHITPDETSKAVPMNSEVTIDLSCKANNLLMSGECKQETEAEQLLL
jgi:hypothetical protein